jgi:hypothetical protein
MKEEEKVAKIIGILMMSRTYAHLAHLKTGSYAQHVALDEFYSCIVDLTDRFAETAQGIWGKLDIPFVPLKADIDIPVKGLDMHLTMITTLAKDCSNRSLNATFDDIEQLFITTLYKLKELD